MSLFAVAVTNRDESKELTYVVGATAETVRAYMIKGNPPEPFEGFATIDSITEVEPDG